MLDGVTTLRLDQAAALGAKIRMERDEPTGKYLLYSPAEEPDYEDDWLLDIRLYSRSFRADRASILLEELGLINQHLRQHLADRRKFFDSKERLQKLRKLVAADRCRRRPRPQDDRRRRQGRPAGVLQHRAHALPRLHRGGRARSTSTSRPRPGIRSRSSTWTAPFWQMAKTAFGYAEDDPSLKKLLIRLLVTDYAHHLKGDVPIALAHLVLPPSGRRNAVVCLAQWRDSSSKGSSYDRLVRRGRHA